MRVLMVGATGKFAGLVTPELTKRGATVRALVRDESKADDARKHGAGEVAIGDLEKPETLRKAAEVMDGVGKRFSHADPLLAFLKARALKTQGRKR